MDLSQIAVFIAIALFYILLLPEKWRGWALMLISVVAIYWLQPTLNIRWLDYSLPTVTLVITVISWLVTRPESTFSRDDRIALFIIGAVMLVLTVPRYIELSVRITSRPPPVESVVLFLGIAAALIFTLLRSIQNRNLLLNLTLLVFIGLFIIIKTDALSTLLSAFLRGQTGQDITLARGTEIGWLGFSYVAFRLIHTIRDWQSGKLPDLSLREYVTYIIFFSAYTAGPIDRAERFITDFRPLAKLKGRDANRITQGVVRISIGLFKKFVIADSLALFSMNATNATQADSTLALWVMLYGYSFRLFLDFSGYSDIAIGIGMLFGIQLPENFDRPYLRNNIAAFWQSWHITLSQWVRFYVYSPLSRHLLRRKPKPPNDLIIFICNMSTMVVIGLWHGVTIPFIIWGVWHGIGLFIHKMWSDRTRKWYRGLSNTPRQQQFWTWAGIFVTFHFVMLGWVWFAMPNIEVATMVFSRLFRLF